jgi:hypothetical protein
MQISLLKVCRVGRRDGGRHDLAHLGPGVTIAPLIPSARLLGLETETAEGSQRKLAAGESAPFIALQLLQFREEATKATPFVGSGVLAR